MRHLATIGLLLSLATCMGRASDDLPDPSAPEPRPLRFEAEPEERGVKLELRSVEREHAPPVPYTPPQLEILDDAVARALLDRVAPLAEAHGDRQTFALRPGSPPPPRPGSEVFEPFPPPPAAGPPDPDAIEPLEVLRWAPEGELPTAPHVSVTFSQPMVAVTSHAEASKVVPVTLEPQPEGEWRWIGTKTLLFDPPERLPKATAYTVTIPAGTRSALGGVLAEDHSFAITTPPVGLERWWPDSSAPQGLRPVLWIGFDQAVDPEAIAELTTLSGSESPGLRLATEEERAEVEGLRSLAEGVPAERQVALIPREPLPKDQHFTVTLPKGLPSAEGPRTTEVDQHIGFRTYGPLRITEHHCSHNDPCDPTSPWTIRFANPLDTEAFDTADVTVEPDVPGFAVTAYGDILQLSGRFAGRTAYTVTVPASVADVFDQTLGSPEQVTFQTGPAQKTLSSSGGTLVVADPQGGATWPVWVTNHPALHVTVHRVGPQHWGRWNTWLEKFLWDDDTPGRLPGLRVKDARISTKAEPDELTEFGVELERFTRDGYGQFAVLVQPSPQPWRRWKREYAYAWVQVTRIGLTAFVDGDTLIGWATDLATGDPLPGVELELAPEGIRATTGPDGLARLELPEWTEGRQLLIARRGDDTALLPPDPAPWGGSGWVREAQLDHMRWYVVDDRGLYRPGETVRVKGWVRHWERGPTGDLRGIDDEGEGAAATMQWRLTGSRGNELAKGTAEVSALGGFDLSVDLPPDANLGSATLLLTASGALANTEYHHAVRIEEFRRPEFEVDATVEDRPYLLGEEARFDLTAAYYAGGGLAGSDVTWNAYTEAASYVPPGQSAYTFGSWTPWWEAYESSGPTTAASLQAVTDGSGAHHLGVHFLAIHPPRPTSVRAEGTVYDVNRQAWTASASVLVHPGARAVGLKTARGFVDPGDAVEIELVVVELDGEALPDVAVETRFERVQSSWRRGGYSEDGEVLDTCSGTSDDDGALTCTFTPEAGGTFRAVAVVRDAEGRPSESELRLWVSGEETAPAREVELEKVTLIPEQREHAPGDTARVLLQAPFPDAEALLTLRRSGVVSTERFRIEGSSRTLEIPIEDAHVPDLTIQVDLVGKTARAGDDGKARDALPPRLAHASGSLTLAVPPVRRALEVSAVPADPISTPGSETSIALLVRDADGAPVANAELAVVVADESVLALTGYRLPDPLEVFYAARGPGVRDHRLRSLVALANPETAVEAEPLAPGGSEDDFGGNVRQEPMSPPMASPVMMEAAAEPSEARTRSLSPEKSKKEQSGKRRADASSGEAAGGQSAAIALREDFDATALFAPRVRTDEQGRAEVPFELPDSLTRYRVMVVAVSGGTQFGAGEAALTARLPLMVRPSLPRFLNFGDQAELPVVVQNQTDAPVTVDVALRATNLHLTERVTEVLPDLPDTGVSIAGRRVEVPANDRVEVRFPAASLMAGTARVQAVAATATAADAALVTFPVWTPATTEAFATYGTIDAGIVRQPVEAPPAVWPQFGGLEISTSSTQLQALTDAIVYLESYPFECNEQLSSRILAIASLRDVLTAFESDQLPSPEALEAGVRRDLKKLKTRQHWNGGWSFWRRGDETWPFLSIHVANALARAKAKGYEPPGGSFGSALSHLRNIESYIPHWYGEDSKRFLRAYALDVRRRMDDADPAEALRLYGEVPLPKLGIEAAAWILPTLQDAGHAAEVDAILRFLGNRVAETAAGAHFVTSYADGAHVLLHSDRRADGIVLEALLEVQPDSELIPKVVQGLLAHRTKGRWSSTQENAFVLLALDRYFRVYESEVPDFVARVWLGEGSLGDHEFRGRTTERAHFEVPMGYLSEERGPQDLVLQQDGDDGRLYYRIGLRYAPRDLRLEPADHGFAVERAYEPIHDADDVTRDSDGVWHIRAGAEIRVRVRMVAPMRRYHVALVDPLPAGLEPVNPDLATSGTVPADPSAESDRYWWWSRAWYEHDNLRDERVEAFASLLWDGVHEYTYVARATTPGRYVVPPAKAEEMYTPETFGRTGTDRVVVE